MLWQVVVDVGQRIRRRGRKEEAPRIHHGGNSGRENRTSILLTAGAPMNGMNGVAITTGLTKVGGSNQEVINGQARPGRFDQLRPINLTRVGAPSVTRAVESRRAAGSRRALKATLSRQERAKGHG